MPTLHWIGKDKVVNHHHEVPFKTLRREYEFVAPEGTPANSTGNRIIHGDNLEALKALLLAFEGRVKCIYIDPPCNLNNHSASKFHVGIPPCFLSLPENEGYRPDLTKLI
jgi:adenine-specific DNA-methyltransferase